MAHLMVNGNWFHCFLCDITIGAALFLLGVLSLNLNLIQGFLELWFPRDARLISSWAWEDSPLSLQNSLGECIVNLGPLSFDGYSHLQWKLFHGLLCDCSHCSSTHVLLALEVDLGGLYFLFAQLLALLLCLLLLAPACLLLLALYVQVFGHSDSMHPLQRVFKCCP